MTSSVIRLNEQDEISLTRSLGIVSQPLPEKFVKLTNPDIGILVKSDYDEFSAWRNQFLTRREHHAHVFVLHLLPTLRCQLSCGYCFENGGVRMPGMIGSVIQKTGQWLDEYLENHNEIDSFRLVLFGGEPLLRKDVVKKCLVMIHEIVTRRNLDFWTEIVTNGELLDQQMLELLAKYNWLRVQLTLDGPEKIHNERRPGKGGRHTFKSIISNIQMLLNSKLINRVDVRISLDHTNGKHVPELIEYLAGLGMQEKINLSLGLITPTFEQPDRIRTQNEYELGVLAVSIWAIAQKFGFTFPDEFLAGPWCIAIAKHAAVLQPNGALQKCFCTSGRAEYDFANLDSFSDTYLKDQRFEHWERTDSCIKEQCEFLPMCGGGCIHDALVLDPEHADGSKRVCQKTLLRVYNEGLLKLKYK